MGKKFENDQGGALTHNPFAALANKKAAVSEATTGRDPPAVIVRQAVIAREPVVARQPAPSQARAVRMRLEAAGRSGKVITRITGLPVTNLEAIASRLGRALGCRARVEDNDVLLAGSLSDRASEWLNRAGDLRSITDDPRPPSVSTVEVNLSAAMGAAKGETERDGTKRSNVRRGVRVAVVLKADQDTGKLTEGIVREILTSSATHPRGIKVRLESGEVGRVKVIYG